VKCNLEGREYQVYGYKGKQVRDNIHSYDVARFIHEFAMSPRRGEVYNLGGGKENSCSIVEAFALVERFTGKPQRYTYVVENRIGDHICYYSDLRKMRTHYPRWDITISLEQIIREIIDSWQKKLVLLRFSSPELAGSLGQRSYGLGSWAVNTGLLASTT
jgi:CDP-paratose 2-epimerase